MKILVTGFAVFGKDSALYGLGETEDDAWDDAAETLNYGCGNPVYSGESVEYSGDFDITPVSKRCMKEFDEGYTGGSELAEIPGVSGYKYVFVTKEELEAIEEGDAEIEVRV